MRRTLLVALTGLVAACGAGGEATPVASCEDLTAQASVGNLLYAQRCAGCHGGVTTSTKANTTAAQIQAALGSVPQMRDLEATLTSSDLEAIAASLSLVARPECPAPLASSNFTRSSAQVIAVRVARLFPMADVSAITNPRTQLGQALGTPDFVSAFAVTFPDSAGAQAAFQKSIVAPLCAAPATSTMFDDSDVLMPGESLPADPDLSLAFTAARNAWLVPYAADSKEVQLLLFLVQQLRADGAPTIEIEQALCMATLSSSQFWKGSPGRFEIVKRVALDIGGRPPTFAELGAFRDGTLTLAAYVRQIQAEPGYLATVKTWHRNWLAPLDYGATSDSLRGQKYWWTLNAPTFFAGQRVDVIDSSGALDPTIPIIRQAIQNFREVSDSDACQPFEQAFDTVTQRIQWEHRVNGQWYVVGGWRLVGGAWQRFGGSVPIGGSPTATTLADITAAPATINSQRFRYAAGPLAALPAFAPGDRRVRRFTVPDDVDPNAPAPATEQNGYSRVNLWWSGKPVYVCNAFARFMETCAYRPAPGTPTMFNSNTWTAAVGQTVERMGGNIYAGVDPLAHPGVLADIACSVTMTPTGVTFSRTGPINAVIMNAEMNLGPRVTEMTAKYPSFAAEAAAMTSIREDMRDEPFNLVGDIVAGDRDYRELLTADWTVSRGPLELYYRMQGHYLPGYPLGATRLPGASDYLALAKYSATSFDRLPRALFVGPLGGQMAGAGGAFNSQNNGQAVSAIDDPALPDLAPRPMSGVLTQAAFLGPAVPKMRTVSARILTTFTCGEVSSFVPTAEQRPLHLPYIPVGEKGGAQHVDPAGSCYGCHVDMDPLAAALSKGFMLKVNPFTNAPILGGSEHISAFGEIAPFVTGDVNEGFRYGVRGNRDLPSKGALFGHPVTGVREVGQVLASSDLFARCAVTQAFTAVLGRPPTLPEDQATMDQVKAQWIAGGYQYDQLVELLVLSPQYQVRN